MQKSLLIESLAMSSDNVLKYDKYLISPVSRDLETWNHFTISWREKPQNFALRAETAEWLNGILIDMGHKR